MSGDPPWARGAGRPVAGDARRMHRWVFELSLGRCGEAQVVALAEKPSVCVGEFRWWPIHHWRSPRWNSTAEVQQAKKRSHVATWSLWVTPLCLRVEAAGGVSRAPPTRGLRDRSVKATARCVCRVTSLMPRDELFQCTWQNESLATWRNAGGGGRRAGALTRKVRRNALR